MGERIILPMEDFQFLQFDLESQRFSLIKPTWDQGHWNRGHLEQVLLVGGRSYFLGRTIEDKGFLLPFEMKSAGGSKN
jgi:hypothetical protein